MPATCLGHSSPRASRRRAVVRPFARLRAGRRRRRDGGADHLTTAPRCGAVVCSAWAARLNSASSPHLSQSCRDGNRPRPRSAFVDQRGPVRGWGEVLHAGKMGWGEERASVSSRLSSKHLSPCRKTTLKCRKNTLTPPPIPSSVRRLKL